MKKEGGKEKVPYTVIWKEEGEVQAVQPEKPKKEHPVSAPSKQVLHQHATHPHEHSPWFVFWILGSLVLIYLLFINPLYMLVAVAMLFLFYLTMLYGRRKKKEYVGHMEKQEVFLTLSHPFKTGFEFAMGVGLFGMLCLIIGAVIAVFFLGGVIYTVTQVAGNYLGF